MNLFREHRGFWSESHKRSLYLGLILLVLSLVVQIGAGRYSERRALGANFVGDLFLDNLPFLPIDPFIVQGGIIIWLAVSAILVLRPRYLLFSLKAIAIFIIVRSFFINLTHIGPYPREIFLPSGPGSRLYELLTFQGNFFFSGHTGLPYLMALIFWEDRRLRRIFLTLAVLFGLGVLFAHVHYSIDVFASPLIVYSIFAAARRLFPGDFHIISGPQTRTPAKGISSRDAG